MEDKLKLLEKELKYLTKDAMEEEITKNQSRIEYENIRKVANDIYLSRGLDISKLKGNITSNLINDFGIAFKGFKNKDKKIKKNMIMDIIYFILLLILLKIPFDLVRDIGYDYIEMLSTNNTFYVLWNLAFLILYTITLICVTIVLIRNFNNKYINNK